MGNSKSKREREMTKRDLEERKLRQSQERARLEEEQRKKREEEMERIRGPLSLMLQSAARGYFARKEYAALLKIVAKRANIAKEILETEKSYVNSLKTTIDLFYNPLMAAAIAEEEKKIRDFKKRRKTQTFQDTNSIANFYKERSMSQSTPSSPPPKKAPDIPGLTKEDVKQIFSQIEVIMLYNEKLAMQLEERVSKWSWTQQLGDIFIEMLDFLKVYINYVNNYNTSLEKLDKLKQIPEFCAFLQETQAKPECKGNELQSFLIMPIQRIPRYVLLLEDLTKNSPEPHVDHANLTIALKRMKDVAQEINEKKRIAESFAIILDIYNRLEPPLEDLCQAHRRFEKQGILKYEGAEYVFILFNDIMLQTKEKEKNKLRMVAHITLRTANVVDVLDDKSKKIKNSFQLETPRKTLLLKAKTAEDKRDWMFSIQKCISEQLQKSKSFMTPPKKRD